MPLQYIFTSIWRWTATTGLNLAVLTCILLLIPRIGRLIVRWTTIKMDEREQAKGLVTDSESRKGRLAIVGAVVYIVEAVAFFFVGIAMLKQFGFSTTGAAVPATVVSAAVAFGAQKIIADFLAGFFIITEHQFGVGDWVVFNTSGSKVEGEVTAITLRATTVRTVSGHEATVPNSVPSVCINASAGWARAVIDMPIPISAATNTDELTELVNACIARTLELPNINRLVRDTADTVRVLPAVELIAPTSAGVPWCLKYRVMIQVEPGEQWAVERAIRASVMNEMWSSYNESTIDSIMPNMPDMKPWNPEDGVPASGKVTAGKHAGEDGDRAVLPGAAGIAGAGTNSGPDATTSGAHAQSAPGTADRATAAGDETPTTELPAGVEAAQLGKDTAMTVPGGKHGKATTKPATTDQGTQATTAGSDLSEAETVVMPAATFGAKEADGVTDAEHPVIGQDGSVRVRLPESDHEKTKTALEKEAEDAKVHGLFRKDAYEGKLQQILSVGGRCRPSTTVMLGLLIILLVLQMLTMDNGSGKAGVLAPPNKEKQTTTQQPASTEPKPSETTKVTPTQTETNTETTEPTTDYQPNSGQSTTGQNTGTAPTNTRQNTTTVTEEPNTNERDSNQRGNLPNNVRNSADGGTATATPPAEN